MVSRNPLKLWEESRGFVLLSNAGYSSVRLTVKCCCFLRFHFSCFVIFSLLFHVSFIFYPIRLFSLHFIVFADCPSISFFLSLCFYCGIMLSFYYYYAMLDYIQVFVLAGNNSSRFHSIIYSFILRFPGSRISEDIF